MAEQTDKLRNKTTPKPLYTKKTRYIAIKKLVERAEPFKITTMETYYPFRREDHQNKDPISRVKRRHKTIDIKTAATHEIHLIADTVTASMEAIGDYNINIAAITNIHGDTRTLLNNRPSGSSIYIYGEGDQEAAYFVLTWKQVLPIPDYKNSANNKIHRERYRYPIENLSRIEEGCKVYYLQKATPEEFATIMKALKSIKTKT